MTVATIAVGGFLSHVADVEPILEKMGVSANAISPPPRVRPQEKSGPSRRCRGARVPVPRLRSSRIRDRLPDHVVQRSSSTRCQDRRLPDRDGSTSPTIKEVHEYLGDHLRLPFLRKMPTLRIALQVFGHFRPDRGHVEHLANRVEIGSPIARASDTQSSVWHRPYPERHPRRWPDSPPTPHAQHRGADRLQRRCRMLRPIWCEDCCRSTCGNTISRTLASTFSSDHFPSSKKCSSD
jgi:hypothetical protein